ncbi:hypothetical protein Pint_07345 [Pistacia integerrima]|uniref:Uncharacterized protein n=1 Tax=Pistacia integerrima TaxID=434235 RepID=A0ACC0XWQ9_9ROSI|nr:hypothetical protein Pint_07345 [Pistacia integerrima]
MATSLLKLCYEKVYNEIYAIGFYLPGSEIPDWFSYQSSGSSITCKLPRDLCNRSFIGFAIFAVIVFESGCYAHEFYVSCDCQFGTKYADRVKFECHFNTVSEANMVVDADHMVLGYVPFCDTWLGDGDHTTASFGFSPTQYFHTADPIEGCKLKCCGVCPLYLQSVMNQLNTFNERFSATNEDLPEIMSEECAKIGEFHDAKISGSSSGRSEENEVEPHPKRICRNQINAL